MFSAVQAKKFLGAQEGTIDQVDGGAPDQTAAQRPMRVNVIVPCHNAARYVGEALESALRQTYVDTTVLVVDDGSTDATARIALGFGDRVTVMQQQKSGPSAARNRALDAADGAYIAFLDADDRWHPEKVSRQVAFLAAHPQCGLVHTAIRHIDAAGDVTGRPDNAGRRRETHGDCLALLLGRNTVTTSSVLLRRDILDGERFLTELYGPEDWDLWLRLASRTQLGYLDEELTDYRFHDSNITRQVERMASAELTVIDRALARVVVPEHRRAAIERRRRILAGLGNLAYERNDMERARRLFRQAGLPRDFAGLVTYGAVWLPARVRQPARLCWRRICRALSASA
jgi:glycosyltransferase involved in cell wall biosynthesis